MKNSKKIAVAATLAITLLSGVSVLSAHAEERGRQLVVADKVFDGMYKACAALDLAREQYLPTLPSDKLAIVVNYHLDTFYAYDWHDNILGAVDTREFDFKEASQGERETFHLAPRIRAEFSKEQRELLADVVNKTSFSEKSTDLSVPSCDKLKKQQPISIGEWTWVVKKGGFLLPDDYVRYVLQPGSNA